MPHRAQESDDRDILGLVVGDWSHHAVVLLEAGNQIADEVELGAGDEHRSQRPEDNDHRRQEAEANRFSAGLLIPRPWFVRDMRNLGDADVTHVQTLAKQYRTSLEACANHYIELTDDTCALVFSKDGIIRYSRRTEKFPFWQ